MGEGAAGERESGNLKKMIRLFMEKSVNCVL